MENTLTPEQQVAATIIQQMGGMGRLKAFVAAHNFIAHPAPKMGVSFKFKGSRSANYIKILLNSMDTYDVEIGKIKGFEYTKTYELEGAYDDMLKGIFEEQTKLYLSF